MAIDIVGRLTSILLFDKISFIPFYLYTPFNDRHEDLEIYLEFFFPIMFLMIFSVSRVIRNLIYLGQ
ncbi:hypothetical protein MXB_1136, partial [Myxobolus squamalis]